MKRVVMAIACSVAVLGAAQADDDTTQLGGFIPSNCFVGGVDAQLTFPTVSSGESITDSSITILCNDADGANLSLRSSESGLESDDNEDQEIDYTAVLSSSVIGGGSLSLDTSLGGNDSEAETVLTASAALAGGQTASLVVTLNEDGTFSGGYSDTLSINIEAF